MALKDLEIGGRPGSIAGKVVAADPTGAVARLVVQGVADTETNALVAEVTVSADGGFMFEDVPSPGFYELVVDKPGFALQSRQIKLGAAQELEGIQVVLREGDGVIGGRVSSPGGPLGGVEIVATSGELEFKTVSLTLDDVGAFNLRTLPTPGSYTLTFQRDGYEPATRTVDLVAAQQLTGLAVTMAPSNGSDRRHRLVGRRWARWRHGDGHRRRTTSRPARPRRASATSAPTASAPCPCRPRTR